MTTSSRSWKVFALAWTLLVAALVAHQVSLWTGGLVVDTDVLALLPASERDPIAQEAMQRLGERASRKVVVVVGAADFERALAASRVFTANVGSQARLVDESVEQAGDDVVQALMPFREGLLTAADTAFFKSASDDDIAARALGLLYQPVGRRIGAWADDPLQSFTHFLEARVLGSKIRPRDGVLWVDDGAMQWVVVQLESTAPAFATDGSQRLEPALMAAAEKAKAAGALEVKSAGVPRFAEAASVQASQEVSTVGLGSMLAILVVMWLAFRSLRPLVLVAATVGLGVAAGLSACMLVFGRVHVVTLVFGAGLVGVAEDYGIHYFANRQAAPGEDRGALLWHHLPGLVMALATSIAGYAMLAVTPFPGLRQVALFSAAGLAAAFLGVVAWFPFLDRGQIRMTRFAQVWAASRARWPVLRGTRAWLALGVLTMVCGVGLWRVNFEDDVRELSSAPQWLLDEQMHVARLMGLPSPAQFFVIHGDDETQVLEREEVLRASLDTLVSKAAIEGYDAVSEWVPSAPRQLAARALSQHVREVAVQHVELDTVPTEVVKDYRPMTVADVLATPVGERLAGLWVKTPDGKRASIVMLRGLGRSGLGAVNALDGVAPGVRFVDRTQEISRTMGRYRSDMLWLLSAGYALVFGALVVRFKRRAWKALAPTFIASVLALAVAGLIGEKVELFHVLALWLLLGMGVDYGIFLLEHPSRQAGEAWLAVGLGAVSTLLSFGLLALSKTPAIHAFGLAMAVGIGAVWAISPLFCDDVK